MKVAVFDVCGTLYDSNTTFDFLDGYFHNDRKYQLFRRFSRSLPGKIVNYPFYRFFNYDIIRVIATSFLKDISEEKLQVAMKHFVYHELDSKVKIDIQKLLHQYKEEGYVIYLMSGSYSLLVEQVCQYFKADAFTGSELEMVNSQCTGRYATDQLFNKKAVLLEKYPDIQELVVVSDNRTDYELMKMADKGFAVCNKPKQTLFWQSRQLENVEILN